MMYTRVVSFEEIRDILQAHGMTTDYQKVMRVLDFIGNYYPLYEEDGRHFKILTAADLERQEIRHGK